MAILYISESLHTDTYFLPTIAQAIFSLITVLSGSTCWTQRRLLTVYSWPQQTCYKKADRQINKECHEREEEKYDKTRIRVVWYIEDQQIKVSMYTVSSGKEPSTSQRAWYICSGVPSKNLPQPPTKRVSPEKDKKKKMKQVLVRIF